MRKLLLFAAAVVAARLLGWMPAGQKDVGDLLPVQTLVASVSDGRLVLEGGEGLRGEGADWASAMSDLAAAAPGEAFFGATGQVVLTGEATALLPQVLREPRLRPAARVYAGRGQMDPEAATAYLDAHEAGVTLQALQAAALEKRPLALPLLICDDGRYHLQNG